MIHYLNTVARIVSAINARGLCTQTSACVADYMNAPVVAKEKNGELVLSVDTPAGKETTVFQAVRSCHVNDRINEMILVAVDETGLSIQFSFYPEKHKEDWLSRQINESYAGN